MIVHLELLYFTFEKLKKFTSTLNILLINQILAMNFSLYMPSIISNVDIGQSFNNVSRQGDNIGRDQLDIELNELFTFDVFCGTKCSGINLEKEFCYTFCEI